jgi:hypothetical protein
MFALFLLCQRFNALNAAKKRKLSMNCPALAMLNGTLKNPLNAAGNL